MVHKPLQSIRQVVNNIRRLIADPGPKGPSTSPPMTPGTGLSDALMTITLAQLDALRGAVRAAEERVLQARAELEEARRGDPMGRTVELQRLARAMLPIVRFAIANLPPSEIPKWPYEDVTHMARLLTSLPDFGEDDQVLVNELLAFVDEIKEHEIDRARRRDAQIAGAPRFNPPRGVPPSTPLAPTPAELKGLADRQLVEQQDTSSPKRR